MVRCGEERKIFYFDLSKQQQKLTGFYFLLY